MFCILKSLVYWVVFSVVGFNLIGFFYNGFLGLFANLILRHHEKVVGHSLPYDNSKEAQQVRKRLRCFDVAHIVVFGTLICAYNFILWKYWGLAMAVSANLIMLQRIPDLIYESIPWPHREMPMVLNLMMRLIWYGTIPMIWFAIHN
jgi:hypothetical protein